ncbi:hypothetical protein MKZ38_006974 [Zalerion maritima]|uniref:Uncharacterized protein n=1 Tax=Zalerion maritima TaxID=339359 RepID=A0AAD5RIY2_9PEZI|nr:hypothetical protein MKZ38_006974 [Zalerion maritima]
MISYWWASQSKLPPSTPPYYPPDAEIKLPGFGLHLDGRDGNSSEETKLCYSDWHPHPFPIIERCMITFMDKVTNKPNWHEKVHDKDILSNWKREALEEGRWVNAGIPGGDFDDTMFDYCVRELEEKASAGRTEGNPQEGSLAAWPLEDVPEGKKDWHPGSDNLVLDLLHPSLWPLVYGRTHILPDREISLNDCLEAAGEGVVLPEPWQCPSSKPEGKPFIFNSHDNCRPAGYWSPKFQWLPCNVNFPDGKAKIDSYINNLYPMRHKDMYEVVEKFIDVVVPMWDTVFGWTSESPHEWDGTYRVGSDAMGIEGICNARPNYGYECSPWSRRNSQDEDSEDEDHQTIVAEYDASETDEQWFERTHRIKAPNPEPYEEMPVKAGDVMSPNRILRKPIQDKGLQVIVKLANIHLTPEKPVYNGGSWHVEGQLNEHIVGTALYCHASENIPNSRVAFRTFADDDTLHEDLNYNKSDYRGIEAAWGRTDWWGEKVVDGTKLGNLPTGVSQIVIGQVEGSPYSLEEAQKLREELMETRTDSNDSAEQSEATEWSFLSGFL